VITGNKQKVDRTKTFTRDCNLYPSFPSFEKGEESVKNSAVMGGGKGPANYGHLIIFEIQSLTRHLTMHGGSEHLDVQKITTR
jgi:hypothetical protein